MRLFKAVVNLLILLLTIVLVYPLVPLVQATFVEYPDLGYHLWDNLASSLHVSGAVIMYEHQGFDGDNVQFTDAYVNLGNYDFDNKASSLKVSGEVTLWDESNWTGWRAIDFTSEPLPSDNWGTQWNQNALLTKNSDKWDSRVWSWGLHDLYIEGPDSEKHINWTSDGLVESMAKDHIGDEYVAVNFDQGWENNVISDRSPDLPFTGQSLKVHGTVTLYDQPNYQGSNISFTDARIAWLGDWANRARSLIVDGTVNLWQYWSFDGYSLFFTKVSAQPTPLKVSETSSIRLEGVVSDWLWNWFQLDSAAGIKFDVILTENHSDLDAVRLMMELYLVRQGNAFYFWNFGTDRESDWSPEKPFVYNYRAAIDMWSEYVRRTIHPGGIMRWSILSLKAFIQRACNIHDLDINNLYISKISYTLEADASVTSPSISCNLIRLRLSYTSSSSGSGGGFFCPTLFSWDGSAYTEEGLLDIHGTSDITISHTVEHLDPVNRMCLLSLRELDNYTSHIDQVKLFAVDAQDNWYESALQIAWHNRLGRVEALLLHDDESRVNLAPTERIELLFLLPENISDIHHFTFQLNGHNPKGLY